MSQIFIGQNMLESLQAIKLDGNWNESLDQALRYSKARDQRFIYRIFTRNIEEKKHIINTGDQRGDLK